MPESGHIAKIELEISDPWEFGTAHGTGPFQGCLLTIFSSTAYDADKLGVMKLDTALDFKAVRYEYLLLQSRHARVSIDEIECGNKILCNLSAISETSAHAPDPLIASRNDPKAAVLIGSVSCRKEEPDY